MDTVTGTPTATSIGAPLDYAFSENKFDDLLATDPYSSMASPRSAPNRGSNRSAIEACLSEIDDRSASEQEYIHKKKKYIRRTPKDAIDQFDPEALLPQDFEEDWFELPLLGSNTVKKVQSANLIHPKMHMGENTVNGSLRCATHDIRGDIPNPKIHVSPWLNSTIEPDTNIRGFCN
ncbi:Hypothetical protein MVR_LOCUS193 [uncultured virus]|nr:Hypothetical protein MVR_LOCUS193 [uncultured virus]